MPEITGAALVALGLLLGRGRAPPPPLLSEEEQGHRRREMVEEQLKGRGIRDARVLSAFLAVPRHRFVDPRYWDEAYADRPLPIGEGQTISQPYMVALMTELLGLAGGERLLEVGTGSGYQAAILNALGCEVYTMEIIPSLARRAEERLRALGYDRVHVATGDGYFGWAEKAPFAGIVVTAAPDHIPQPLLSQLAPGGRMVIPVGPPGAYQTLWQVINEVGGPRMVEGGTVRFVPLVHRPPGAPAPH